MKGGLSAVISSDKNMNKENKDKYSKGRRSASSAAAAALYPLLVLSLSAHPTFAKSASGEGESFSIAGLVIALIIAAAVILLVILLVPSGKGRRK